MAGRAFWRYAKLLWSHPGLYSVQYKCISQSHLSIDTSRPETPQGPPTAAVRRGSAADGKYVSDVGSKRRRWMLRARDRRFL